MGNVVIFTLHFSSILIIYQYVLWIGLSQNDYFPDFWCDHHQKIKGFLYIYPDVGETCSVSTSTTLLFSVTLNISFHIQASFYKMKMMFTVSFIKHFELYG